MATDVLIADANVHLAEVMRHLLNDERGFRVVGVTHTAEETLALAKRARPHVVLVDPNVPPGPGDLCAALHKVSPRPTVLLWSHARKTGAVSDSHVHGVVQRGASFRQLVEAIHRALAAGDSRR